MIAEIDIWRSANLMVREHGEDAALEAAQRADTMLERGDMDGCAVWKRILKAIEELQREVPKSGERPN
jgi:triphosphoribosyl-dephospho-CoA synthetase